MVANKKYPESFFSKINATFELTTCLYSMLLNQKLQDMRITFTQYSLFVGLSFLLSCQGNHCRDISGAWSNREGRELVFQNNGSVLWLTSFGQLIDTVKCVFVLNCQAKPATLDFSDFNGGPFQGKYLFGIIEWSADSLFRFCYEIGEEQGCRPQKFDPEQTIKYYR